MQYMDPRDLDCVHNSRISLKGPKFHNALVYKQSVIVSSALKLC